MNAFLSTLLILFTAPILLRLEGKRVTAKKLFLFKPRLEDAADAAKLFAKAFLVLLLLGLALNAFGWLDSQKIIGFIRLQPFEMLLLMVSLAPFAEEMLFRGYLQHRIGVVFSSALFAGLHYGYGSVSEVAGAFVVSMVLGAFMRRKKRLLPCVIAHAAYNAFSILLAFLLL
ncbi:hypothetical protein COU38_01365 [Candidatus Micrarchaeota archaeon CG10_big_fil_rev_8_21_14_0_10_54_18]|nr:MAG: hypothetical protein COT57_00040 [Candidatus Micrarchaeota archaeon CG09_land_8_20_14_0_10_55_25]PJD01388.1 MAG: hypothetical protein COU38_01365 [Candidatus Micrarchaeota archaeon CG10_big_fil_rev_8_21_14_0_10_54_18]